MISVYLLKNKFQALLRPISNSFVRIGISANFVTISAFMLSGMSGVLVYMLAPQNRLWYWILPIILFVRMALNAIDGMIAKEHNQKTDLGAILNELGDMLSDCVIYIPFLYTLKVNTILIMVYALLAVISEAVGIMGLQIGASRRYDGPMGKSDRAFWMGLMALILAYDNISQKTLTYITSVMCGLLVFTLYNRIVSALREVNK